MCELSCDDNSKFYGPCSRAVWSDALAPRLTMCAVRLGVAASPHHRRRPRRLGGGARSSNARSTSILITQLLWRVLTSAIVTGVLDQWSPVAIADFHAADLALQDAFRIAPGSMSVRGAQCQILRAMRTGCAVRSSSSRVDLTRM
jgi:hypothetical protein